MTILNLLLAHPTKHLTSRIILNWYKKKIHSTVITIIFIQCFIFQYWRCITWHRTKRSHHDVQQHFPACFLCSNLCQRNRHRQWESRGNNTVEQYSQEHVASRVKRHARSTTLRAQQRNIFFPFGTPRDDFHRMFNSRRIFLRVDSRSRVASRHVDVGPRGRAALPRWPPCPSFHVPSTLRVGSHARRTMTRCERNGEAYFRPQGCRHGGISRMRASFRWRPVPSRGRRSGFGSPADPESRSRLGWNCAIQSNRAVATRCG